MNDKFQRFFSDPMGFYDDMRIPFRGKDLNFFPRDAGLRRSALAVVVFASLMWLVGGFDSGIGMLYYPLEALATGKDVYAAYTYSYGKEMHWSAFVIYGFLYVAVSQHLASLGVAKTRNTVYSASFSLGAIAVFELFWMWGFATFQNQGWVLKPAFPQLRIHVQNAGFLLVAALSWVKMWAESDVQNPRPYRWKSSMVLVSAVVVAVAAACVWVYYPFPVQSVEADIVGFGRWVNSSRFPQTLYTLDLNVLDSDNCGVWFYVEDNVVHLVNTVVKVLWAWACLEAVKGWRR